MTQKLIDHAVPLIRAVVIHPDGRSDSPRLASERLEEASGLARALDLDVRAEEIVRLRKTTPATLFGTGKVDELAALILGRAAYAVLLLRLLAASPSDHRHGRRRIDAEHEIADQGQHHAPQADAADARRAKAAPILDVAASATALPTHALFPSSDADAERANWTIGCGLAPRLSALLLRNLPDAGVGRRQGGVRDRGVAPGRTRHRFAARKRRRRPRLQIP